MIEVAFGVYMFVCLVISVWSFRGVGSAPFLAVFAAGYFYVGFNSMYALYRMNQGSEELEEETEPVEQLSA
jgi:hypothetical protein